MADGGHAIRAENLSRHFGHVKAVDELSLEVREGEIFGLVGPDGAGKTTTIRLLAGILSVTAGAAWVTGRNVLSEAEAIKPDIGYVSQTFSLYPDLTVIENLQFYADIYGVSRRDRIRQFEQLLAITSLEPFRQRPAGQLSGGMKQKLSLCCALLHSPRVLLLDEPTNGVDPLSRREFWRILSRLSRDKVTVFIATAYLHEAERCSRVGFLHQGRLLATGTPNELKGLVQGIILEFDTPDPRRAVAILRQHPAVLHASRLGTRVHLTVTVTDSAREIADFMAKHDVPMTGIHLIPPSLEDVFVSMLSDPLPDA